MCHNKPRRSISGRHRKLSESEEKSVFSWVQFGRTFKLIWPYVWPSGKPGLQLRFLGAFCVIAINRALNVLIPILYRDIVDALIQSPHGSTNNLTTSPLSSDVQGLTGSNQHGVSNTFPWQLIMIFVGIKLLGGGGGYLNCLRGFLWISVFQNAQKQMRLKLFSHIHSLSVRWHQENRRTGAVVTLVDRGIVSMNLIISNLIFNVLPTLADIVIAFVFFVTVLNVWTGLIVFVSITAYLVATVVLGEWRTKYKRGMTKADNERSAAFVDSILNYETVKCFTGEEVELKRYIEKIDNILDWDWKAESSSKLILAIQKTTMMAGLLGVSLLVAWYVWSGQLTVGDFVLFCSYVEQLYSPLTLFSACYRILQDASVNMAHMADILKLSPDVTDGDKTLSVPKGEIVFDRVSFQYTPGKPILQDVTFTVPAGQTYAIVGGSGSGKSTILKLLLRFYDVTMGKIEIDGQDIAKVSQKSLRRNLGILQQNATLFNQSIKYNISYSKLSADDSQVTDAATEAQIHDRVVTFPDGYNTKVGENGVKLSGGEKRRIVIARAILEGANIVLLDEATTGLDNKTEHELWEALERFRYGKTCLIVSHQLSHIANADHILVLKDGQIVEQGKHAELRRTNGFYEELWLLEHPEEMAVPDIVHSVSLSESTCVERGCSCPCHAAISDDDNLNGSLCSGMKCYCTCHDLEVEQQVLAILQQECEEGLAADDDDTISPDTVNDRNIKHNKTDAILRTISEVSLSREIEAANHGSKKKPGDKGMRVSFEFNGEGKASCQGEKSPATEVTQQPPRAKSPLLRRPVRQYCVDINEKDDNQTCSTGSPITAKRPSYFRSISESFTDSESMKLIVSGRSFNLKPKHKLVSELMGESIQQWNRSLPSGGVAGNNNNHRRPPRLNRANTVDASRTVISRNLQEIQKKHKKKQEKFERAREKAWNKAYSLIDETSSVLSLHPEDLATMDSLPDDIDEECLHPLCHSLNLSTLNTKPSHFLP